MIKEIMQKEKKSYSHVKYMIDNLLDQTDIQDKDILDIGCGNGIKTATTVHFGKPKTCIGIDISHERIKKAQDFLTKTNKQKIKFYEKNIEDLKGKNQFDVIIMINSLHHFSNLSQSLNKILQLLRPNGKLIIQEQNKYAAFLNKNTVSKDKYLPKTLIPLIRKAGFKIMKHKYYIPYKLRELKPLLSNGFMNIIIGKTYFIYGKKE